MGDEALADELHLTIRIAAIEAQASGGQRDAKMVGERILELLQNDDFSVGGVETVFLVLIGSARADGLEVGGRAVIYISACEDDAVSIEKLDLLDFTVMELHSAVEIVKVEVVEGFLGDPTVIGNRQA